MLLACGDSADCRLSGVAWDVSTLLIWSAQQVMSVFQSILSDYCVK